MISITIKKSGASEGRVVKFRNGASFTTEVLPSIVKSAEFACGSVLWVDSGKKCKRLLLPDEERPLMAPLRICNAGFSENIGALMSNALLDCGLTVTVVNAEGTRYEVSAKKTRSGDSEEHAESSSDVEPSAGARIEPVVAVPRESPKESLFADVEGYVPRKVKASL